MKMLVPVFLMAIAGAAQAQAVYKCNWRSYSEQPCSDRVVRTYEAPVERRVGKPRDVVAHRLPGESADELATRKRRVNLPGSDRDECARLDKKIPFEQQRIRNSVHQEEIDEAQQSLGESRKRFRQLRC
jgi:hypothetical protein